MTKYSLAKSAYGSTQNSTRSPRSLEYEAFSNATRALWKVHNNTQREYPDLIKALYENRRLWNFVASSVAGSENQLPDDLRARLFYLAEFTDLHSREVVKNGSSLKPLIDLNTAVASALHELGA